MASPRLRASAIRSQRPRVPGEGRKSRSNSPRRRSTVPTIESSGITCSPRSTRLVAPSAATTSSKGSMCETSSGSKRSREASRDSTRRRRSRSKAIFASSRGSPVLTSQGDSTPAGRRGRRDTRRVEAVILCGVQGSGKTTLYRDRFLETHARVSLDLLRTRAREAAFLKTCLDTRMPFVVDNTNPTVAERARYIEPARAAGFTVVPSLVAVDQAVAAGRNAARERAIPASGLRDVARRLVRPTPEEGFDALFHATAALDGGWRIEPLLTTPPLF